MDYNILKQDIEIANIPELWDGKSAKRIVNVLLKVLIREKK